MEAPETGQNDAPAIDLDPAEKKRRLLKKLREAGFACELALPPKDALKYGAAGGRLNVISANGP